MNKKLFVIYLISLVASLGSGMLSAYIINNANVGIIVGVLVYVNYMLAGLLGLSIEKNKKVSLYNAKLLHYLVNNKRGKK